MKKLKNRSLILFFIAQLFSCQTSKNYEVKVYEKDEFYVVNVTADRVIHECHFMNAEKENNWRHQYLLYILNDKREVITAMFPTNQGSSECNQHLKKVEKILKNAPMVSFCLRGVLKKVVYKQVETYDFSVLGTTQKDFYNPFMFDSICNSKECFSISDTWTDTCPHFNYNAVM